jgi:hypothetical protein
VAIIELLPAHLTLSELILKANDGRRGEELALETAIQTLRRSGLVRLTGDVVEPTYAAVHAAALFESA